MNNYNTTPPDQQDELTLQYTPQFAAVCRALRRKCVSPRCSTLTTTKQPQQTKKNSTHYVPQFAAVCRTLRRECVSSSFLQCHEARTLRGGGVVSDVLADQTVRVVHLLFGKPLLWMCSCRVS
jgi:hypothetical protein